MPPKYLEIKQALIQDLQQGLLELPSEEALAQRYGVSRMTARRALEELRLEGLIERRRGRRAKAQPPRFGQGFLRVRPFYLFAQSLGATPGTRLLRAERVKAPQEVAERLGVEEAIYVERLRLLDGEPVMLESRYLRADLCAPVLEHDLEAESIHEILVRDLGLPLTEVWQRLEAVGLEGRAARLLGVRPGAPGFLLRRVTYTYGRPVTWVEYRMRGDRYYFEDRFAPQKEV